MLFDFLKGSKGYFLAASILAFAASGAEMLRPKIIQFTIDSIIGEGVKEGRLPIEYLKEHLVLPALLVIACSILALVLHYYYQMCAIKGSETFVRNMRDALYTHILKLPAKWHSEHQTGDIIQRCTMDTDMVKGFLSDQLVNLFGMIITLIMAIIFMLSVSPLLSVICILALPLITGFSILFHRKFGEAFMNCDIQEGILSTLAQENLTGVRVVRAFGREKMERDRFKQQNHKVTEQWVDLGRYLSFYWGYMDFQTGVIMLSLLGAGSYLCVKGTFTVGGLTAMVSYLAMMMRPIRGLGRLLSEMSKTGVSIERLHEIMVAEPEEDPEGAGEPPLNGDIEFSHVSFAYPGAPELLHDLSFRIPAGTTLGILGNTGSGKSTLAGLLSKLLPLPEGCGTITIGGNDIQSMKTAWVRKNTGYVLQEPYLFSKTIAANIGITHADLSSEEVEKAAANACLSEAISHFARGYDTFVGERGVTLSGGQKQRAAIARTLTTKTPILIFDDSLSAVDAATDVKIRENLKTYMHDTTVILISHRISTLMEADNILVLEDGRITDMGTHDELMNRPGLYRRIAEIQQGKEDDNE